MAEKQKLHEVGAGIKEHAESKTHELTDATRSALHESAEKSKAYVHAIAEANKAHSKELLHHSHSKVSEWLGKLKNKIHHKA